ncbi:unnamed protein product [Euphydryas editha]|uniref:Uncharacterized protein n=1 Tax=Euphydryas editha TaxID=104508 RepID=A0AAU9UCK7_EUPED|nr:unnamed protein product [Euphydryas editha]
MLRHLTLILVVSACGSCMEMQETVERMVMVRTSGSDLQPAATGYIYKKKNDGKESVIEMGESEVMEHLAKLYEQPKAFAAPIPITNGRSLLTKEEDKNESESPSEERVIPVKEKQENHIDGIVDEDYKKIFDDYLKKYDDHNAYDDYVRSLKHFGDGLYDGFKGDDKHDDGGYEEYKKRHNYGNGNSGDYHKAKYESYVFSDKSHKEGHDGANDYKKLYGHVDQDEGYGKKSHEKDDVLGFHKVFDKDDQQGKDHKIYDGDEKFGFHKFTDGHKYHGADDGYEKDGSYESRHHAFFGKRDHHDDGSGESDENHSAEEKDTSSEKHDDYGHTSGQPAGQSYGFEIKH